jgi:hypothetical protein
LSSIVDAPRRHATIDSMSVLKHCPATAAALLVALALSACGGGGGDSASAPATPPAPPAQAYFDSTIYSAAAAASLAQANELASVTQHQILVERGARLD